LLLLGALCEPGGDSFREEQARATAGALRAEAGDQNQAPDGANGEEGAALAAQGLLSQSAWPFPKEARP
jgi:hypothetical protein